MTDEAQPSSTQPIGVITNTFEAATGSNAASPSAHTHESLLRRIHTLLSEKFTGIDHELNALLAEAKKIL